MNAEQVIEQFLPFVLQYLPQATRGPQFAIQCLQVALNILVRPSPQLVPDGRLGPKTLAAVESLLAQKK